jgi:hypothetical protein
MRRLVLFVALVGCVAHPLGVNASGSAAVQCHAQDRMIPKQIRFGRGRTTAVVKDTVKLCTWHAYSLRARHGQTMSVHLAAGKLTSFSLEMPSGPVMEADGVTDWTGELPDTGEYVIHVSTDATAAYTLEVTIR